MIMNHLFQSLNIYSTWLTIYVIGLPWPEVKPDAWLTGERNKLYVKILWIEVLKKYIIPE